MKAKHSNACSRIAAQLRRAAIESDAAGHALRECAFNRWRIDTLFPQAVNRWIEGSCRRIEGGRS